MLLLADVKKNINHFIETVKGRTPVTGYRLNSILNEIADLSGSGGGYTQFSKELTQAEMRTLNSANGTYGAILLPDPGLGKMVYITNPRYIFKQLANSAVEAGQFGIYQANDYQFVNTLGAVGLVIDITFLRIPNREINPVIGRSTDSSPVYLYSDLDWTGYLGTLIVEFDYKIINLNEI